MYQARYSMPDSTNALDVFFNRASVAVAKRRSIVKSWLPPSAEEIETTAAFADGNKLDNSGAVNILPDHVGVGAESLHVKGENAEKQSQHLAKEKLRKQILGNARHREISSASKRGGKILRDYPRPSHVPNSRHQEPPSDDDEDSGKASIFASKKRNAQSANFEDSFHELDISRQGEADSQTEQSYGHRLAIGSGKASLNGQQSHKRGQSFLNNLLEERQVRRSKRQRKFSAVQP